MYGASALDITPTILAMLGLPVGAGMDGRVLRQIFDEPPTVRPSQDQAQALDMAVREADYNLAQVYPGSARPALALPLLEKLTAEAPDTRRFELPLAQCYFDLGRREDASPLLDQLPAREPALARGGPGGRTDPQPACRPLLPGTCAGAFGPLGTRSSGHANCAETLSRLSAGAPLVGRAHRVTTVTDRQARAERQ